MAFLLPILLITVVKAQTIRINEVSASNSIFYDEDGDTPDWIELHNFGTQTVSLNNWTLSDDVLEPDKWTFPSMSLAPNQYLLLWASSKDRSNISYATTLVNQGDSFRYLVPFSEPDSNWKNINFNDSGWALGASGFGYDDGDDETVIPNGTLSIYLRISFEISDLENLNSLILDMDYDDAFVAYINGAEVARANINGTPPTYNSGTIQDHEALMYSGGTPDRFLITNPNNFLIDGENILTIQAHNVSSNSSDFTIIPFLSAFFSSPNNTGIEPPTILGLTANNLHTNFKISSSGSETIRLNNASGGLVNQIITENLPENTSIGVSITSGDIVNYSDTTPGYENSSQEYVGSVQSEVVFSNQGGLINAPISLSLSGNTSEEVIRYTIGDNNPTETSPIYTSPIEIKEDTTVRAQIFLDNYLPSSVSTKTYILNNSTFTDSNLPIIIINTENGAEIPDEPKILGTMKIIQRPDGARNFLTDANNDDFLNYSGTIGIETRGSSSQALPKKPYGIDTLEDDGIEDKGVKLLGMPKEDDWILNSFAFDDSMMRDYISYEMTREMGQYAANLKYCEVVLNGDYIGLYALSEKIKRDGDRVNIAKLSDDENSFPEVSGGYLMQTDRVSDEDPAAWYSNNAVYIHEKPNSDDITQTQSSYIEGVFKSLDNNATNSNITSGYPSIIDIPSFVDYMLIAEIASNADAYALSTYYHKDRGGKLRAGPVWDYNLTFGNDLFDFFGGDPFDRSHTYVWQFKYGNVGSRFWGDLFNNATFKCYLAKRFDELTKEGQPLNFNYISNLIDSTITLISEATNRENERWETIDDFSGEIATMKVWIQERITWMRNNLGAFSNCNSIETPSLVISKISYNPLATETFTESKDLEFIEIQNIGTTTVNLTGVYLSKLGVSYQFEENATILPAQAIQLAGNTDVFFDRYGLEAYGRFDRDLSNSSQNLVLADAFGNIIDQVEYTDSAPWPETADGDGFYLELIDVNSDNALASSWKASSDAVLNTSVFNSNAIDFAVYPNPTKEKLTITSKQILEEIIIFNPLGQQIKTFQVNFKTGSINISNLKKGMYFLILKGINGEQFSTKIFKE